MDVEASGSPVKTYPQSQGADGGGRRSLGHEEALEKLKSALFDAGEPVSAEEEIHVNVSDSG